MTGSVPRGPFVGRLGFRLMSAMGLALLPLALLTYFQATRFENEAQARAEAALFGDTLQAAAPQVEMVSRARGMAQALALAIPNIAGSEAECDAAFRNLLASEPAISFAGYIPVDGVMRCSSNDRTIDFSGTPDFAERVADPVPKTSINAKGAISNESVLIVSHPSFVEGVFVGFVTLSLPHRALEQDAFERPLESNGQQLLGLATFDGKGTVLTAIFGIETVNDRLPADRPMTEFVGQPAQSFVGLSGSGDLRSFAVVPVISDTLYIISSWPPAKVNAGLFGAIPLWVFPSLMFLASMTVAWLAAETQVLRHVRALRRSIIAFAGGNRAVEPPDLSRAAGELRDVGDAYERMMDSVLHDEATLEDTIHQKEVLLREVHHRVKNNLQLIASIMNIQMRKATSPEAKTLVKGLHDRVMSLATVHRELYQTSGLTDVKADELLSTIVAQVTRMGAVPGRMLDLETGFDQIRLTPDQAVPLSLVLTEALTNVFKHAQAGPDGRIGLSVTLRRAPDARAVLRVGNSVGLPGQQRTTPPMESTGLGAQLLTAFSTQLNGQLSSGLTNKGYSLSLEFPVRALSEAEARFADP